MVYKPGFDVVPLDMLGPPIPKPFIGSPFAGIPDNDGAPTALLLEFEFNCIPPPFADGVPEFESPIGFCLFIAFYAAGFCY